MRWIAALLLCACPSGGGTPDAASPDASRDAPADTTSDREPTDAGDAGGNDIGATLRARDRAVASLLGSDVARQSTSNGVPVDDTGLIGRNREWGALFSPRFQLGAGPALRTAIALGDISRASAAFRAIEVAAETIEADGRVPSDVPPEVAMGMSLRPADVASGAAFFLGDACLGLLALNTADDADTIASEARRASVIDALGRGAGWLETQRDLLETVDARAPNRLFHDAVAFQACGVLANDAMLPVATDFANLARAQYDERGFFIEGGGFDTNYQAVNVVQATELRNAGFADGTLDTQIAEGLAWMIDRTSESGAIDSTGNARSCEGCEVFLPGDPPKEVGIVEWLRGLSYAAVLTGRDTTSAIERFVGWVRSGPSTSCYAQSDDGVLAPLDLTTACASP
ncbi:MAG: hypothetical protein AAGE52_13430 [Myxococcota bacterium]